MMVGITSPEKLVGVLQTSLTLLSSCASLL